MRRTMPLLLIFLVPAANVIGQTSAYQTSDSTSSILIYNPDQNNPSTANVVFNVASTEFTAGYLHLAPAEGWSWGFGVFGKPSTGLSNQIFQTSAGDKIGGSITFGYHSLAGQANGWMVDDWLMLQLTYTHSAAEIITDASSPAQKRTFDGPKALLLYNFYAPARNAATILFGFAGGMAKSNNIDALTPVTINSPLLQSAVGVTPSFTVVKSVNGYSGLYRTYTSAPIYTDAVIIPRKLEWTTLDFFTRSDVAAFNRYIEGGIGLFIAAPNMPTKVLGGITWSWKNGKPMLGIVAGWAF